MKKGKKALLIAGGILGGVIALTLVSASLKSANYRIERSIEIAGSADAVFVRIADLSEWEKWSPWKARDAKMKFTYSGPKSGTGAIQNWTSPDSGDGTLKITESLMNQKIRYLLTFKGWDAKSEGEFRFEPVSAAATRLVWTMEGKNGFMGKLVWMLGGLEKTMTADFDQGLANIKHGVEQTRADAIAALEAANAQAAAAQEAVKAAKAEALAKAQAQAQANAKTESEAADASVPPPANTNSNAMPVED